MLRPRIQHTQGPSLKAYRKKGNKAQSALEYAVVITCIVAALLAMQVYFKRGMQGRLRQTADELGQQYAPGNTTGSSTLTYNSHIRTTVTSLNEKIANEDLDKSGNIEDVYLTETKSELVNNETGNNIQTQSGSESVGAMEPSLY